MKFKKKKPFYLLWPEKNAHFFQKTGRNTTSYKTHNAILQDRASGIRLKDILSQSWLFFHFYHNLAAARATKKKKSGVNGSVALIRPQRPCVHMLIGWLGRDTELQKEWVTANVE